MNNEMQVEVFVQVVAERLKQDGIAVELLTYAEGRPGLLSCRRPDIGRTVFLLADSSDCSHAKANVIADYVRQEIPPA